MAVVLLCVFARCTPTEQRETPAELRALGAPHFAAFEEFDGWARRSLTTSITRSDAALEEALFAPVRRDRTIAGIWVERTRVAEMSLGLRFEERPRVALATIRDELMGELQIAQGVIGEDKVVFIARKRESGPSFVEVVVAFVRPRVQTE